MPSKQPVQVLVEYWPFARCVAAFNVDNFIVIDRPILVRNLLRAFFIVALLASLIAFVYLSKCWSTFDHEIGWSERAYQLASVLCLTQQFVIYILMAMKNRRIIDALHHLQQIVDSRKFPKVFDPNSDF